MVPYLHAKFQEISWSGQGWADVTGIHTYIHTVTCHRAQALRQYSVFCHLSSVYCLLSTVYCLLSTVYSLQSTVYWQLSTVYCLQSTVFSLQSSVFSVQSSVFSLLSSLLFSVFCLQIGTNPSLTRSFSIIIICNLKLIRCT